jgi:hypothetical protein
MDGSKGGRRRQLGKSARTTKGLACNILLTPNVNLQSINILCSHRQNGVADALKPCLQLLARI